MLSFRIIVVALVLCGSIHILRADEGKNESTEAVTEDAILDDDAISDDAAEVENEGEEDPDDDFNMSDMYKSLIEQLRNMPGTSPEMLEKFDEVAKDNYSDEAINKLMSSVRDEKEGEGEAGETEKPEGETAPTGDSTAEGGEPEGEVPNEAEASLDKAKTSNKTEESVGVKHEL